MWKTQTPHEKSETPHEKIETPHEKIETSHEKSETPHEKIETPHEKSETPHEEFTEKTLVFYKTIIIISCNSGLLLIIELFSICARKIMETRN